MHSNNNSTVENKPPSAQPLITSIISSEDLAQLYLDLGEGYENENEPAPAAPLFSPRAKTILVVSCGIITVINAIYEDTTTILAIKAAEKREDSLAYRLNLHGLPQQTLVAGIYFIYSVALNGPCMMQGIEGAIKKLKEGIPIHEFKEGPLVSWLPKVTLSAYGKRNLSVGAVIAAGILAAGLDAVGCYVFPDSAGEDLHLSTSLILAIRILCMSTVPALTFFTEPPEMLESLMEQPESIDNAIPVSRLRYITEFVKSCFTLNAVRNLLARILRYTGAIEFSIEIYVSLLLLINDSEESQAVKYLMLTLALTRSVCDNYYTGKKSSESIDAFIARLAQGKINAKEIASFLLTNSMVLLVVDAQRDLYIDFLEDPSTSLPFPLANSIIHAIAILTAVREGVLQSYVLYPFTLRLVDYAINLARYSLSICQSQAKTEQVMGTEMSSSKTRTKHLSDHNADLQANLLANDMLIDTANTHNSRLDLNGTASPEAITEYDYDSDEEVEPPKRVSRCSSFFGSLFCRSYNKPAAIISSNPANLNKPGKLA